MGYNVDDEVGDDGDEEVAEHLLTIVAYDGADEVAISIDIY